MISYVSFPEQEDDESDREISNNIIFEESDDELVEFEDMMDGKVECGNCHSIIEEDATVCPYCGVQFEDDKHHRITFWSSPWRATSKESRMAPKHIGAEPFLKGDKHYIICQNQPCSNEIVIPPETMKEVTCPVCGKQNKILRKSEPKRWFQWLWSR